MISLLVSAFYHVDVPICWALDVKKTQRFGKRGCILKLSALSLMLLRTYRQSAGRKRCCHFLVALLHPFFFTASLFFTTLAISSDSIPAVPERWSGVALVPSNNVGDSPLLSSSAKVVFGVMSPIWDLAGRERIRSTWAHPSILQELSIDVSVVFIVGTLPFSDPRMRAYQDGDAGHDDVLRVPVVESYAHVVHKFMHFCTWAARTIPSLVYLGKLDDDAFVHLPALVARLHLPPPRRSVTKFIFPTCFLH